jgi:iron complex transport system substrate-binding protein
VTDLDGNAVEITDVSRIVPLSGDIAEIVWTLGLAANVVGVDVSAVYPAGQWDALPKIGFERQLSAEGILALNPTVIIGKEQAGPAPVIEQLRGAGVPVVILPEPPTIEAPVSKIRDVADALGLTVEGEALATQVQEQIDAAIAYAATAESRPVVLFLYVRGGGTQLIGGQGSVADAIIEAAGGVDAGVLAGVQGFVPVSAEALATAAPEIIVVPQSGVDSIGGLEALRDIPGVAQTPAASSGAFLVYDDLKLLGMTPRSGDMIRELAQGIHPELASDVAADPAPVGTPVQIATPAG